MHCNACWQLIDTLSASGITIRHLDLGGGLGVRYRDEQPPSIAAYIAAIRAELAGRDLQLLFEPGRSIAANAGLLVTRVEYLKPTPEHNFALVDAAMNDMIRPALYQAWLDIQPVEHSDAGQAALWDVVGPVCETGDFLGKDRELTLSQGDLLALFGAGAYGFTMSSNYNSRARAPEIMVDGEDMHLVRERETIADMMRTETCLPARRKLAVRDARMQLKFTKMHGAGNDFVVIDLISQRYKLAPRDVRKLADRHFGVGCDQVLVVEPPSSPAVDFRYRIYNADGGEVEQCGNGARCFARFVRDKKLTSKRDITVETAAGIIELRVRNRHDVEVDMGVPRLEPADIPFRADSAPTAIPARGRQALEMGALSMGNPHAVLPSMMWQMPR